MSQFRLKGKKDFGSIQSKLYSYTEKNNALSTYIKAKIEQPVQHFQDVLENYGSAENLKKKDLLKSFQKLRASQNSSIPAFDVKRSTVTEFMAEFLLKQEFQCIFFEQTHKKRNKSVVDTHHHSTGVDIVGLQGNHQNLKFVVAEMKAPQEETIPCPSARNLRDDIKNVLDFANQRLFREILALSESFDTRPNPNPFQKCISFLLDLMEGQNAPDIFVKSIIVFPFLIHKNVSPILEQKNLNDFQNFSELDTKEGQTIGIVWAINKDIDLFVQSIDALF